VKSFLRFGLIVLIYKFGTRSGLGFNVVFLKFLANFLYTILLGLGNGLVAFLSADEIVYYTSLLPSLSCEPNLELCPYGVSLLLNDNIFSRLSFSVLILFSIDVIIGLNCSISYVLYDTRGLIVLFFRLSMVI